MEGLGAVCCPANMLGQGGLVAECGERDGDGERDGGAELLGSVHPYSARL